MKSSWFTSRSRYEFGKLLAESSRGSQSWDTFASFLQLSSLTLRQACHAAGRGYKSDEIEAEYMREVKRVDKPERLAEAMGVLVDSLEETQEDFLGKFMSEMSMNDKSYRGQCFTPTDVCRMMAKITLHDLLQAKPQKRLLIAEPACGCGAMVIAAQQELREQGLGPYDFYFVATDIDWRCAAATFVQLTLLDVPATVNHGNTLSLEVTSSYETLRAILSPWRDPEPETPQEPASAPEREPRELAEDSRGVQLELF